MMATMKSLGAFLISLVMTLWPVWSSAPARVDAVRLVRLPAGGIQPEAVIDDHGVLHVLYFAGEPAAGDLFYLRSTDGGSTFSKPVRVNSQTGSAIATGTIRGGQLAVAPDGQVHVVWNGSDAARPRGLVNPFSGQPSAPFLYSRSASGGTVFEAQRDLTRRSFGVDGGGSIAADRRGHVYAAWHALPVGGQNGEDHRLVWVARSEDSGATFAEEQPAWREPTGACSCCGLRLFAGPENMLFLLFRSATQVTHRDVYLLESRNGATPFRGAQVAPWNIGACAMTSMALAASGRRVAAAWETAGQVYVGDIDVSAGRIPVPVAAPGEGGTRKHPRIAINATGETLFVWTEGTAWARGGSLAWQLFDRSGRPADVKGQAPGVPVWSFAAPVARADGSFLIVY
jgi:hypothetical protein